jgi:hypothetical protein
VLSRRFHEFLEPLTQIIGVYVDVICIVDFCAKWLREYFVFEHLLLLALVIEVIFASEVCVWEEAYVLSLNGVKFRIVCYKTK